MKKRMSRTEIWQSFVFTAAASLVLVVSSVRASELSPEQLKFFESKIRPVLIKECYGCHSDKAGNVRGGLRVDTESRLQIGGTSGPAIVAGDLEESLLFNAINHEDWVMPPKRKLSQAVINDFREWIEMGAPDPRVHEPAAIRSTINSEDIERARSEFWAYQKPVKELPPTAEGQNWAKTTVDRFVLHQLEQKSMTPSRDASPAQILRRLCFDLVGLPPTPEQVDYFESRYDSDPETAIKYVADRLMKSPQFGERWGRHWLDVARYAESTGREVNMTYPHAWRYRDYVIDSFNADKPYNEFVQEQLAGDLMTADSDEDWAENLIATTFLAIGPKNVNEQNRVQFAVDLVDEQIDATTRVFLGSSVSCARCHDHKFDAIPQQDYYALAGVFSNLTTYFGSPPSEFGSFTTAQRKQNSSILRLPVDDPNPYDKTYSREELARLKQQMQDAIDERGELRRDRNGAQGNVDQSALRKRLALLNRLSGLSDELAIVDENGQPRSYTMGVQERKAPRDVPLLVRGEIDQATTPVERGVPQVFCEKQVSIPSDESGRLQLAEWIGSDQNTLAARVMVNRIWKHLLGNGIVTSTENFGVTGAAPTHPELLDYLAVQFVESDWSVKSVIREIVSSRVYRQSSDFNAEYHLADADNALLWRANPRRLDAEVLRDGMLMVSGQLELQRPRGSEVAKAGFSRVRDGVLGDPREQLRKAANEVVDRARTQVRNGGYRNGYRSRRQGGATQGQGDRRSGSRGMQTSGDVGGSVLAGAFRKVANQLDMEDADYRSVYLPLVRNEIPRSLEVFDFVDASTITGVRETSDTANQALFMLNNPFVLSQSKAFAARLSAHSRRAKDQIRLGFELAFSRAPTKSEMRSSEEFLRSMSVGVGGTIALDTFCQSLFASAEFRYIN